MLGGVLWLHRECTVRINIRVGEMFCTMAASWQGNVFFRAKESCFFFQGMLLLSPPLALSLFLTVYSFFLASLAGNRELPLAERGKESERRRSRL